MNKKIALILACCAATSFAACNETTEWNFTESCGAETKRCVESTIQVCKDGVWVPETTCEGATPWCDVTTHTCIAKPAAKDCQDGAQKCDQNAVWTCKTGKWEKTTDCNEGDKTCNSTTYVCDPKAQPEVTCDHNGIKLAVGATVCDGETTLKTCTASEDGTTASLTSTDCSTDNKVCGNDADNKAACIDGQQPAPSVKCTKDGDETEYEVGAKYCGADNTLYTCTASADGTTATFESVQCQGDTPVCDNTANDCRAYNKCTLNSREVAHDALACDGNVSKKCNDGTLEIVKDCATDAQVCLADTGVCGAATPTACTDATGTVENGKTVCKENNVYTCNNTQLSKTTDCTVTEAEAAAHLVSVCTPGEQGANATCVKKCAEDYKFGEGDNANKCVAAHDQQCKINTVDDKQVAQYRKSDSHGIYSEWENCNTAYNSIQNGVYKCDVAGEQCVYDNQCESGYHEVDDSLAGKSCQHDITNECKDLAGAQVELDAFVCMSETQVGKCQTGENYTATVVAFGNACDTTKGMVCDSDKVGTLFKCACTEQTPSTCSVDGRIATINSCDPESGKMVGEQCPTNDWTLKTTCNTDKNACDVPVCKPGYVLNNKVCGLCGVDGADACPNDKLCDVNGKCSKVEACTDSICSNGVINECKDADGTKTLQVAKSCIENGVGTCTDKKTCSTEIKHCNNGYLKVGDKCEAYSAALTCTENLCDGDEWYKCKAPEGGATERHYDNPVAKPAVDANGTWACDVKGWTLTCTETELYEVKDGKCALKAGRCKADADCKDATKTKCNTTTKVCEASATPAPECTAGAIQCVDETKYKTCTAGGKWDTTEKTVETGLKCDTTANKLVCKDDAAKTCDGTKVMGCKDGKLSQVIQNCATNTDGKTTCSAGECVGGGITFPMINCGTTEGDTCSSSGSGYNKTLIRTIDNVKAELKGNYTGGDHPNRAIKDSAHGLFTVTSLDGAKLNKIIITYVFTGPCKDVDVVEIKADSNVVSTISCTTDKQIDHSISFPVATSVTISKKGGDRQFMLYKLVVEKQ